MPIDVLQQLGLSLNEAKIYEVLLDLKEASIGAISLKSKIHRRSVYDAVERLINKGFVFPIITKKENLYSPVNPDKFLGLLNEKEMSFKKILPELQARYAKSESRQEAFIYRGMEGVKNYMRDILRVGKDAYSIGAKLGIFDPRIEMLTSHFLKESKRKGIKFYCIFDHEVKEKEQIILNNLQLPCKFLPPAFSTQSAIDIFGDYVVTYTGLELRKINDNVTLFVLCDKNLAESYRKWFKLLFSLL